MLSPASKLPDAHAQLLVQASFIAQHATPVLLAFLAFNVVSLQLLVAQRGVDCQQEHPTTCGLGCRDPCQACHGPVAVGTFLPHHHCSCSVHPGGGPAYCILVTSTSKPQKLPKGKRHEVVPKLKQDMRAILTTNWKIWIPFQFLNFNFVPQQLQVC